jgi:hypothetical protein
MVVPFDAAIRIGARLVAHLSRKKREPGETAASSTFYMIATAWLAGLYGRGYRCHTGHKPGLETMVTGKCIELDLARNVAHSQSEELSVLLQVQWCP